MTSGVDSCPKMLDQTCKIGHVFLLVSWTHESMFLYHGHYLMQILEINQVIWLVASYLHPVLLVYLDGFLPSKALTGWLLEHVFWGKKEITALSGLLLISLDGTLLLGQSNILILTLAINMKCPLSYSSSIRATG